MSNNLENNSVTFGPLANNQICNNVFQPLPPIYLQVRSDSFFHRGIGNPSNPYDYTDIQQNIFVYCDDVFPPFITLFKEEYFAQGTAPSPCDSGLTIPVTVELEQWKAAASCNFEPLVCHLTKGIFGGQQVFMGIEQVVDYCAIGTFPYVPSDFDIDFEFEDGNITDSSLPPGGIGYVLVRFQPDDPISAPNGPGTYFFVVNPSASISIYHHS